MRAAIYGMADILFQARKPTSTLVKEWKEERSLAMKLNNCS
jgi:hypothetical protein